jgi:drug/metabolite transporter (DMT)-like permease
MVLGAVLAYSIASTLYAPLQQTYGSLRVTLWLLILSTVMLLPLGLLGLPDSSIEPLSISALLILGVVGTGVVWALFVGLIGRVGAVRSSVAGYLVPIVALLLGVVFLSEQIEWIQAGGVAVTLIGRYIVSRGTHSRTTPDADAISSTDHPDLVTSQP